MGFSNIGKVWTPETLAAYLDGLTPNPRWKAVCLHHCYKPDLALRPTGFTVQHIINMRDYYKTPKPKYPNGWSSGPHFYCDDDQIFGMCPPNELGVHAVSFNSYALGIEALGNYGSGAAGEATDDPKAGRGLAVWTTTAKTTAVLLKWLKLPANPQTVLFHREDPQTTKTCPGTRVSKDWILGLIQNELDGGAPLKTAWTVTVSNGEAFLLVEEHGNRPCVPVYAFLTKEGIPSATVIASLKSKNGVTSYNGQELQGAFLKNDSTWAPVRELTNALGWQLQRDGFDLTVSKP